ncbi:PEP/pyruvate-binding domain-containing protein [Roseateles sp. DB2]|uniref:PEP/pyruvate-binding domain-containing protein n=1 Tax=Roseateles sp. DB2 TaxID=3453717 RepID=UPI003EE897BF
MHTDLPDDLYLIARKATSADPVPGPSAIGNKAHNLARMVGIGLRVPPAFVIGTAWCARAGELRPGHWAPAVAALEEATGGRLGDPRRPLLLSVRSGAPVSMPGMMETLLNIGLNDAAVQGLVRGTGNPRLAWDAYRRLVAGFGEVVLGLPASAFEADLAHIADEDHDERALDFDAMRSLTQAHLRTVERLAGRPFPQDPQQQLGEAIDAVFRSWQSEKALTYRRLKGIADSPGTAVTVQAMVFGNAGGDSGAGVGFTRHPSTGEPQPWVDYLFNAQGEDVVSGRRSALGHDELQAVAPTVWQELLDGTARLEAEFGDMQDFEFTVERGRLYWLQTRNGKRTPQAAARIALDLHDAGRIDRTEALRRTEGLDAEALSETVLAPQGCAGSAAMLAQAQSACTGVAVGEIALDEARVRERQRAGVATLLLRQDAETSDIGALELASGLLTSRGARTSHAAVVARQLGKVCLVGCDALEIDLAARRVRLGGREFAEGEVLTLDGHSGAVHVGALERRCQAPEALLVRLQALRTGAG